MRLQLVPEDVARFLPSSTVWPDSGVSFDSTCHRPVPTQGALLGRGRAHGLLEGDRTASGPGRQWLRPAIFRRAPAMRRHIIIPEPARFASRSKIAGLRHPPLSLRPLRAVLARSARRLSDRHEGRDGRGRSDERTSSMTDHDDIEPPHAFISDRPRPYRTAALRLPSFPRPARSEAASRGQDRSPAPSLISSTPWSRP